MGWNITRRFSLLADSGPDFGEDVFIPTNNLNRALDKDKVKVYVYNRRKGKRPEGEVIEVVERAKTDFVGVIDIQKNFEKKLVDVKAEYIIKLSAAESFAMRIVYWDYVMTNTTYIGNKLHSMSNEINQHYQI